MSQCNIIDISIIIISIIVVVVIVVLRRFSVFLFRIR